MYHSIVVHVFETNYNARNEELCLIFIESFALVLMIVVMQMAISLPWASFWEDQTSYLETLWRTPRIAFASLIAFVIAQTHDVRAYHFWKKLTKWKHLWMRNTFSTMVSQSIDTVLFTTIAFWWIFPVGQLIVWGILLKGIIAIVDTPFLYLIRRYYGEQAEKLPWFAEIESE